MNTDTPVLQVQSLGVSFKGTNALSGVTFAVPDKSVVAIVGPAQSGKSTLLKALNRMNEYEPGARTTGQVWLKGRDIYSGYELPVLRQKVGLVFQRPSVFRMSVYDNVAFAPRLYGTMPRAQLDAVVESSLQATGLWQDVKSRLRKPAGELTRGEQQRLCIARVLAAEPEVLVMDDPTAELDAVCTLRIEELVRNVAKYRAVVLVAHDVHQAARLADWCGVLVDGQLVEYGPAERVLGFPEHELAQSFLRGQMD